MKKTFNQHEEKPAASEENTRLLEFKYEGSKYHLRKDKAIFDSIEQGFSDRMKATYARFTQEAKDQYLYAAYFLFQHNDIANKIDKEGLVLDLTSKQVKRDQNSLKRSFKIFNELKDEDKATKTKALYAKIYNDEITLPEVAEKDTGPRDEKTVQAQALFATVLPASHAAKLETQREAEKSKGSTCVIS